MPIVSITLKPDRPVLEASALAALVELWLTDCQRRLPVPTVDGYQRKIVYFLRWWESAGAERDWLLDKEDGLTFARWLSKQKAKYSPSLSYHTRCDVLRRVRSCFIWAFHNGHVQMDCSAWFTLPPDSELLGTAKLRVLPPITVLAKLLQAAMASIWPTRDAALLAVLLGTGLRRAECAALDVSDVQLDADGSGVILVRKAKRVKGRNVQSRQVAIDALAGGYLRIWLDHCADDGPLWVTEGAGQRLGAQGVYKAIKRLIIAGGLEDQIQGPHDLRRMFATTFARSHRGQVYDQLLSMQLGHSSFRMTAEYVLQSIEDLREVMTPATSPYDQPLPTLFSVDQLARPARPV